MVFQGDVGGGMSMERQPQILHFVQDDSVGRGRRAPADASGKLRGRAREDLWPSPGAKWVAVCSSEAVYPVANCLTKSVTYPVANCLTKSVTYPVANCLTKSVADPVANCLTKSVTDPVANCVAKSAADPVAYCVANLRQVCWQLCGDACGGFYRSSGGGSLGQICGAGGARSVAKIWATVRDGVCADSGDGAASHRVGRR